MNRKELGFFTRHFEKLILSGGLLIFLVIVFLYVIGQPYAETFRGQKRSPVEIEEQREETAKTLRTRLNTFVLEENFKVFPYGKNYNLRLTDSSKSGKKLDAPMNEGGLGPEVIVNGGTPEPYLFPHPPLPLEVVVRPSHSVYQPDDQTAPQQVAAIRQIIGDQYPADFPYVSIQGLFDMDQWVARLRTGDENRLIPEMYWRGKQAITAVYLQRQEQDPLTGQWLPPTVIQTLPTQVAFTPDFTQSYTDALARQYVDFVKENQELIARPDFVPLASHAKQWIAPDQDDQLTPEEHRAFAELSDKIAKLEKQITRLENQMNRQNERGGDRGAAPARRVAPPGPGRRPGGGGARGGAARAPGGGAARAGGASREGEQRERLQRLLENLQEAKRQRDELRGVEMDAASGRDERFTNMPMDFAAPDRMMPGPGGRPMPSHGGTRPGRPTPVAGEVPEPVSRVIKVWAHDLTVERGKTYRYRLLVSVINPLFQEPRVEEKQKDQYFNQLSLGPGEQELAQMPWTDPVVIEPEFHYFLLSGTASQQLATVEVWRIFDGFPRSHEFTVQPGDPIGGIMQINEGEVDMDVGLILVDLVGQSRRGGVGGSTHMLYIDPAQNDIQSLSMETNLDSDQRIILQNEKNEGEAREEVSVEDRSRP